MILIVSKRKRDRKKRGRISCISFGIFSLLKSSKQIYNETFALISAKLEEELGILDTWLHRVINFSDIFIYYERDVIQTCIPTHTIIHAHTCLLILDAVSWLDVSSLNHWSFGNNITKRRVYVTTQKYVEVYIDSRELRFNQINN